MSWLAALHGIIREKSAYDKQLRPSDTDVGRLRSRRYSGSQDTHSQHEGSEEPK